MQPSHQTYCKELTDPLGNWCALLATIGSKNTASLRFETFNHLRFRLINHANQPLLWGNIERDWYGVNLLKSYTNWKRSEMPVPPITSQDVESAANLNGDQIYKFWTRYFFEKLMDSKASPLCNGKWLFSYFCPRQKQSDTFRMVRPSYHLTDPWITDVASSFENNAVEHSSWETGLTTLKKRSADDASRVKWWRKKARENQLPPILAWQTPITGSCLLLDGHDRLAAALCENTLPQIVLIFSFHEKSLPDTPQVQATVIKHLEQRGDELSVEKRNEILLAHFDNRPICQSRLITEAKNDPDKIWEKQVSNRLNELGMLDELETFIPS